MNETMSGSLAPSDTFWQARTVSLISFQRLAVMDSAWSVDAQKSSAEQYRAKSQASASGWTPLPRGP